MPEVRVLQTSTGEGGEIILTIESPKAGTACHKGGQWITKLDGREEWVTIRPWPVLGRPTCLRYRPKRYQCQAGEGPPTTTQRLEWQAAHSPPSFADDNHSLLQLGNSTVEAVSLKEGLS